MPYLGRPTIRLIVDLGRYGCMGERRERFGLLPVVDNHVCSAMRPSLGRPSRVGTRPEEGWGGVGGGTIGRQGILTDWLEIRKES